MNIMKYLFYCITFTAISLYVYTYSSQKAVINVAVADLIGNPIATIRPNEQTENAYHTIALCGVQTNSAFACPRMHQLLYNDIVEIIKIHNDEAYIHAPHAFYVSSSSPTPSSFAPLSHKASEDYRKASENKHSHYWTLKKNITLLDDIINNKISINHLPEQIDFTHANKNTLDNSDIVTLQKPHYDSTLKITFSVGTRFVKVPTTKKQSHSLEVFAIDYKKMREYRIKIPRKKCMLINENQTTSERITNYVTVLKKWAHAKPGCIPYIWGGTSFTHTTQGSFKEVTQKTNNSDYSFYQYEKDTASPKSGFDCSGVILRAAQICGIPYFCKNTATIPHSLKPLQPNQQLANGDLILVRGHVMVVSDITRNMLIEARAYAHGYGKLQEIPINEVFDDIKTYDDLCNAYRDKKIVKRKDKQGKVRDSFANLQLLSMASIWDTQNL